MPVQPTHLAILDWGIGGMGFYRLWRRRRPEVPVLYWSDTGATPYGKLSQGELRARVETVCRELEGRGASRVVVACNAASTVVDDVQAGIPVDGIIERAVEAACAAVGADDGAMIGVLGGRLTVESGIYHRRLEQRGMHVDARVAQPISALVERGVLSGPELESTLDEIVDGLDAADAVLLACTHYPAVRAPIERKLPEVPIIDPAETFVDWVDAQLSSSSGGTGEFSGSFLTTGSAADMKASAEAAFDVQPDGIREVSLEDGES